MCGLHVREVPGVWYHKLTQPGSMQVPIFARALDTRHAAELKAAGADSVVIANVEAGANLAASILAHLGSTSPLCSPVCMTDVSFWPCARSMHLLVGGLDSGCRMQLRSSFVCTLVAASKTGLESHGP